MELTIQDIYYGIAILVASITIGGTILKLVFVLIESKLKSTTDNKLEKFAKDYMDREEAKQTFVTSKDLSDFCLKAQTRCPRGTDVNQLLVATNSYAESIKEILREQRHLRQDTLPEKYVNFKTFDDAMARIEDSITKAINEYRDLTSKIFNRVDKVSERVAELKGMEVVKNGE